jgi:MFS family permease
MKNKELNYQLLILGFADLVSFVGSFISWIAIQSLIIFRNQGDTWDSSFVLLAAFVPTMLLSPLAGKVADHIPQKVIMITSQLSAAVIIFMLYVIQDDRFIIPLVILESCVIVFMVPARISYISKIVKDKQYLEKANALLNQFSSLAKISGPF